MSNKQLLQEIFNKTDKVLAKYVISKDKKDVASLYLNSAVIKEYLLYLIEDLSNENKYKAHKILKDIERNPEELEENVRLLQSQIPQKIINLKLQKFVDDKLSKLIDEFVDELNKFLSNK